MTKSPRFAARGQAAFVGLAIALGACLWTSGRAICAQSASALSDFPPTTFAILNPKTRQVIGHLRYALKRHDADRVLSGESRYDDGQYDVETDVLAPAAPNTPPRLMRFEHSFFRPGGSPMLIERADLKSGEAICIDYRHARVKTRRATLDFPDDTYAGASLLIPIEFALRAGRRDPVRMHAFGCVPGPRLLTIVARPLADAPPEAGDRSGMVAVDVRPSFGWWDVLLRLFVPKVRGWFDPADHFAYAGGQIQRFYRGPWIDLVRRPSASPNEARRASPSNGRN